MDRKAKWEVTDIISSDCVLQWGKLLLKDESEMVFKYHWTKEADIAFLVFSPLGTVLLDAYTVFNVSD